MSLPNGFDLATDAAFRLVAGFTEPPKAGRVLAIEANGQLSVELDDADGGTVLAWPLNGFGYAVNDVVYVLFAANAPESGIVLGSIAPAPTLPGTVVDDHGDIPGLSDDDHTQYAQLAGRGGGQVLRGGTASGDDLTLESTSHASKGDVLVRDDLMVGPGSDVGTMLASGRAFTLQSPATTGNSGRVVNEMYGYQTSDGPVGVWIVGNQAIAAGGGGDRIFQMQVRREGANDSGSLQIIVWNAGTPANALTIMPDGRTAVGTSNPAASTRLDIQGTDGALLLPRLTTTQRDALTAANGMVIFNSTAGKVQARAGGSWVDLH